MLVFYLLKGKLVSEPDTYMHSAWKVLSACVQNYAIYMFTYGLAAQVWC